MHICAKKNITHKKYNTCTEYHMLICAKTVVSSYLFKNCGKRDSSKGTGEIRTRDLLFTRQAL